MTEKTETDFEIECEILSKKIQSKFYQQNLFTYLAETDYYGEIKICGDLVRIGKKGDMLNIDRQITLSLERVPCILESVQIINNIADEMVLELKTKIESEIIKDRNEIISKEMDIYVQNIKNNSNVQVKSVNGLSFASNIVMAGGIKSRDEDFYDFVYLYGFKWGLE